MGVAEGRDVTVAVGGSGVWVGGTAVGVLVAIMTMESDVGVGLTKSLTGLDSTSVQAANKGVKSKKRKARQSIEDIVCIEGS